MSRAANRRHPVATAALAALIIAAITATAFFGDALWKWRVDSHIKEGVYQLVRTECLR